MFRRLTKVLMLWLDWLIVKLMMFFLIPSLGLIYVILLIRLQNCTC